MNVRDFLRSVRDQLRGAWSPTGTVAIAIMVVIGLMAVGVLHVYLKSRGIVLTGDVNQLRGVFAELGYDTARIGTDGLSVPRLFVSPLPEDLTSVRPAAARKKLFIQAILPQVLLVNELVLASRKKSCSLSKTALRPGRWGGATANGSMRSKAGTASNMTTSPG
jgi:hypothetical protein